MLQLSDFFAPLNFTNILIFSLFIISCEVIGYRLTNIFIKDTPFFLRGALWLLGLGIVVFVYFLAHFFVPFSFPTILIILVILTLVSAKFYIETKGVKSLLLFLRNNVLPLIIICFILPQVFVKSSQPPYVWDEMAYHYISPHTLYFEKVWNTGSSLTQNLPRFLETAYISLFSLTKTYSVARLLHFSIFVTFLLVAYSWLKQRFGIVVALAFFLLTLFSRENLLLWSTFGYVDVATMSFVMIGFFLFLDYFFERNMSSFQLSLAFLGMGIGTKYSVITQLITFLIFYTLLFFGRREELRLESRKLLVGLLLLLTLGGYWYFKNLIATGNPLYPFLFGCRFESCETLSTGYTIPFTAANISVIVSKIFLNSAFLQALFIVGAFLSLTFASRKVKQMVMIVILFVVTETILVKGVFGFEMRYFFHWQTLSILAMVAPLSILNKKVNIREVWKKIRMSIAHE